MKKCIKCNQLLDEDEFYWADKKKIYKQPQCKQCKKIYYQNNKEKIKENNKEYYQNNKEKYKEHSKQYYTDNKEKHQIYYKQYVINNKENIKNYNKQWRKNNKEQIKQYQKQYNKNNKEQRKKHNKQYYKEHVSDYIFNNLKYRNILKEQTPDLNEEEQNRIKRLYKICKQLNYDKVDFHVDHIQPLSKGGLHHPDNLQILPNWLNSEKHDKWPLTEDEQIKYEGFKLFLNKKDSLSK